MQQQMHSWMRVKTKLAHYHKYQYSLPKDENKIQQGKKLNIGHSGNPCILAVDTRSDWQSGIC